MTLFNQHIRMTASEIAMGRYMRAPDHPPAEDFSAAFDQAALEDAATNAAEGGADGKGAATEAGAGEGDGAGDAGAAGGVDAAGGDGAGASGGDGAAAAAEGGEAGAAAPAEGEAGKEAGKEAGGDGAAAAGADAGSAAPAAAATDSEDILKRLAAEVAKQAPPPAEAKPAEPAAAAETPMFTADEEAKLTKFKEDWPDVADALDLRNRELGRGVVQYIFDQIAPEVKQIKDLVQVLALRAHAADLTESIGDYSNEEVDQIKDWVKTQPAYLQSAYLSVIDQGTAEEVSDLVNRYREVTGKQPAGTPAAEAATSGGDTELSGEAKKAAAALAPVGSKRSVVPDADDKSSFDAGWAQFADAKV